jgi:hypothetical protein
MRSLLSLLIGCLVAISFAAEPVSAQRAFPDTMNPNIYRKPAADPNCMGNCIARCNQGYAQQPICRPGAKPVRRKVMTPNGPAMIMRPAADECRMLMNNCPSSCAARTCAR